MNKRMRRYIKTKKEPAVPEYAINEEKKKRLLLPKWCRNLLGILILFAVVLYLPPLLFHTREPETSVAIDTDVSAVLEANEYLKDNPDMDFDGDGLVNAEEKRAGSDPYRVDTDGDGIMDLAELKITETNPAIYNDTLKEIVRQQTEEAGKEIQSPFKIGNVVLWPDNIEARAYGAVVKTLTGYRFCNFKGWAQFPEGQFAYEIKDGVHRQLKSNRDGCIYIPGPDTTVEVYGQPLDMVYEFSFCGIKGYFKNRIGGEILCAILPETDPALLRCKQVAMTDLDPDTRRGEQTEIRRMQAEPNEDRFGRNHILLDDLARVRSSIEEGTPVLASLFSPERGEAVVEIYGYTADGHLLAADPVTGEELGAIQIEERASRLYDQEGEIVQYEWFIFQGLGFGSVDQDRISFFSAIVEKQGAE